MHLIKRQRVKIVITMANQTHDCQQVLPRVAAHPAVRRRCTPTTAKSRSCRSTPGTTRRRWSPRSQRARPCSRNSRRSHNNSLSQRRLSGRTGKSALCLSAIATSASVTPTRTRRPTRPRSWCPALNVEDRVSCISRIRLARASKSHSEMV